MWKELKAFFLRGNVVDLAVAVVIGAAFGKIITSIVDNIIMPCIGFLTADVDLADLKYVLQKSVTDSSGIITTPEVAIGYGLLINALIQFLIIALVIFLIVKIISSARAKAESLAKKEQPEEPAVLPNEIALLSDIRDLLKADKK
jgi:large conductance mechanosensitive channel